jgi:Queuosine salvage protein
MNQFLASLEPIWRKPVYVRLNEEELSHLAMKLASESLPTPNWRNPVFPPGDDENFIDFLGVGNAINFAFSDFATRKPFKVDYKGANYTGAFAMWACLLRALESGMDILRGSFLSSLDMMRGQELFAGQTPIPMLADRIAILREVGSVLNARYGGRFSNLFQEAEFKAFGGRGIVDRLIAEFPSFVDISLYSESLTYLMFQKRAQLLPMMYQGRALSSEKLQPLADFRDLGPIADYAVPRALRGVNVLQYSSELDVLIHDGMLIPKNSLMEQEIRVQTTHAQVELLEHLNQTRPEITILALDFAVWSLGSGAKEPHHLTVTTAY